MKRKGLMIGLAAETAALLLLVAMPQIWPQAFTSAAAFPFEQIGLGLKKLSALGGVCNGAAVALLALIAALPLVPVLRHVKERERLWEHLALAALSILLLVLIPRMAQEQPLASVDLGQPLAFDRMAMGLTIWSCVVLWGVLRLLRLFSAGEKETLYRYLRWMLVALCALFVGAIVLNPVKALLAALPAAEKPLDAIVAAIRCAADALPYALDIAIIFAAMSLLGRLLAEERDAAKEDAARLCRRCCMALGLDAAAAVIWNVLQIALAGATNNVSVSVNIPVVSLAFVLLALLFARLVAENGRLADENEAFI